MRRTAAVLAGLAVILMAVAGCGQKNDDSGIASATGKKNKATNAADKDGKDGKADFLKYAKCMRENGVDMPDPKVDEKSGGVMVEAAPGTMGSDSKTMDAAIKKCQSLMPPPPNGGKISEKDKEEALKFAKCMRRNGVNMPDPTFDGKGMTTQRLDDAGDPKKFEAAAKKCGQGGMGFSVGTEPAK